MPSPSSVALPTPRALYTTGPLHLRIAPQRTHERRGRGIRCWEEPTPPSSWLCVGPALTAPRCPHEQRGPQRSRSPSWGEDSRDGEEERDPVQTANSQVHSLTGRAGSRWGWLVLDLYPEPPSSAPKQVDAKPEFKPSDLMAQTKVKSRAENRPRLSFYSSSSLLARLSAGRPKGWGLESSGASFIHIPGSWWWLKLR